MDRLRKRFVMLVVPVVLILFASLVVAQGPPNSCANACWQASTDAVRSSHGGLRCGCDHFEPSEKDAHGLHGRGRESQREQGVYEFVGDDDEETGAFIELGMMPGLYHGLSFVLIEALGDEDSFQFSCEQIDGA